MTKKFCDICEKPAIEDLGNFHIEVPHGEPYKQGAFQHENQCYITLIIHFGFRFHPQGFGGPPDLCRDCILMLIDKLRAKVVGGG